MTICIVLYGNRAHHASAHQTHVNPCNGSLQSIESTSPSVLRSITNTSIVALFMLAAVIHAHTPSRPSLVLAHCKGGPHRSPCARLQAPRLVDEDGNHPSELPKILVGVCAMDRKVGSCPRLAAGVM